MSGEIRKRVIAQRNERRLSGLQQRRMGPTCVFTVVSVFFFFFNSPLISSLCRPPERSLMFTRPARTHQVLSRALTCSRARVRACACLHRAACQEFISFFFSSLGHCCGQIFFAVWTLSLDHKTTCWPHQGGAILSARPGGDWTGGGCGRSPACRRPPGLPFFPGRRLWSPRRELDRPGPE